MLGTYLNVRALAYCVQSLGSISDIIKKKKKKRWGERMGISYAKKLFDYFE
jgi:hypothetical protein